MIANIDTSLIDWSRAQFALTAMYHWLFVPLTLGLGIIQALMETLYVKTGKEYYLDGENGDFYYLLSGSKVYSMPSLYTDDYYTMPTLLPFVNNEITLLEGSVTSLTVVKNSRIRE